MTKIDQFTLKLSLLIGCMVWFSACSNVTNETLKPLAIEAGDECHVCGMLIHNFPGPKGQAVFDHQHVKFCSTRDMMTFYLDEENTHRVSQLFAQDMKANRWDAPEPNAFIDGKKSWYVVGSSKHGAMGPTLGSFRSQEDAQGFAAEFGGDVKFFSELNYSDIRVQLH